MSREAGCAKCTGNSIHGADHSPPCKKSKGRLTPGQQHGPARRPLGGARLRRALIPVVGRSGLDGVSPHRQGPNASSTDSTTGRRARPALQRLSRQSLVSFDVFVSCSGHHIRRQPRRGRRFVPVERLQVIAHELFIETGRALPNHILVLRPETRRIRRKTFVNQQQLPVQCAELEFCVGDNDAAFTRVITTRGVNLETQLFHPGRAFVS